MKTLAIAILLLFATGLFGAAFASGCMAMPRAPGMAGHAQEQAPSCCAVKAACMGGSCIATVHDADCTSDHGVVAAGQKGQSAPDLVKGPEPSIVPALLIATVARDAVARPPSRMRRSAHITGYADVYARTGRLLI
jgi:hypothetical protein